MVHTKSGKIISSEQFLNERQGSPPVTPQMARSVSQYRRDSLEREVEEGKFKGNNASSIYTSGSDRFSPSPAGFVTSNSKAIFNKFANINGESGVGSSGGFRGHGGTLRQSPDIYSPLWLNSNLNLPRDRATINSWSRAYFALNGLVQNAISLHSTYPLSKLSIKCKNPEVEKFFADMIEEIDLMNICTQIAQEWWILGEAFVYAELDETNRKWSRLLIQNPDYIVVQRSVVADEPIISLRPDDNLKRICNSNRPADIQQRQKLDKSIIEHVKRGENIPLNNFYVSHLARRINPYDVRGTGLIVSSFRQLMLMDKLRECYSTDCEVLTDKGFKTIDQLTELSKDISPNSNYVNGVELDENGRVSSILKMKEDFNVACVNPDTNEIEYHKPIELHMSAYNGKMLHFSGKKIDTLVSPNHKMWVKEQTNGKWGEYKKLPASQILEKKKYWKFNCQSKYVTGNSVKNVNILGHDVPIELYLKVLGYVVSEGCVYENFENNRYDANVSLNQLTSSDCYEDMRQSFEVFADKLNKISHNYVGIKGSGYSKNTPKEMWQAKIAGKDLTQYFKKEIGVNNSTLSADKHLPRWVLNLKPELLKIILNSLVLGDGSDRASKYGTGSKSYSYSTISRQLADDVYELVYKVGFVPNICISTAKKSDDRVVTEYIVMWSTTEYGNEPIVYTGAKNKEGNGGGAIVEEVDYDGVVWCFEVPTGLFITRRNGKIAIHGNSKFAQADNLINPLTLVKIGGEDYKPSPADLDAWRQVFEECYDEETEVLTDSGFEKLSNVIECVDVMDGTFNVPFTYSRPLPGMKVACFNPENQSLEYYTPSRSVAKNYDGEMIHFSNKKIDIKVTPNHDLYVSKKKFHGTGKNRKYEWLPYQKIQAKEVKGFDAKFRSNLNWIGQEIESVKICGKDVPVELYLEYLGYLISEGCLYSDGKHQYTIGLTQTYKKYQKEFQRCMDKFSNIIEKSYSSRDSDKQKINKNWSKAWDGIFCGKELYEHFKKEIGDNLGNTKSEFKKVPRWVFDLSPKLLKIFIEALIKGDGSHKISKKISADQFHYFTTSKQLANDVFEIAYKCGFVPILKLEKEKKDNKNDCYRVSWSDTNIGKAPLINSYNVDPRSKVKKNIITTSHYNGKVYCLTVPTGLLIIRRNGKISIQGNCQNDKDFKIFTHDKVTVERVGAQGGIIDINPDITQLIKEIYTGLMVPSVLMDGGADTTYANGGVALDVLRQRYMEFRTRLTLWLRRKIFAPISKINDFYDYSDGKKVLIVPDVDWNHMSLFDAGDYINVLKELVMADKPKASHQTLYRSLGLVYEDEMHKIRQENIQDAIFEKEKAALSEMSLNELRAIGPGDEITESAPSPLPGEQKVPGQVNEDAGGVPGEPPPPGSPPGPPGPPGPPS